MDSLQGYSLIEQPKEDFEISACHGCCFRVQTSEEVYCEVSDNRKEFDCVSVLKKGKNFIFIKSAI